MIHPNDTVRRSVLLTVDKHAVQTLLISAVVSYIVGCSGSDSSALTGGTGGTTAVVGSSSGGSLVGAGGVVGSGGRVATGGVAPSGGNAPIPGGTTAVANGGTTAVASGGNVAVGGAVTGGNSATGVSPVGGATAAGGKSATGSTTAAGGKSSTGGTTATGGVSPTGGTSSAVGGTTAAPGTKTPGTPGTGAASVDPSKEHQSMDGFGIADVWIGKATHTAALRTLFWDPVNGIGMSLLRVGIDSTGKIMGDAAFVDAPDVVKYGGKVWAAPWSPPANLKDNNNLNNGGHLNTASYETWATTLAAFPAYFKQNAGVDLWGLSAQNEPDYVATYQSCIYSASQMNAWIKVLGPKLKALNPPVALLAAEPDVWSHTWNDGDKYGNAIEGDATVSSLVDIIATHDYGSNNSSYTRPAPPATMKHHLWETEIYYTAGAGIGPALDIARGIYSGITTGGASGWHYWWTTHFMDGGSAASPPKRVYAMGNYSKFVRPGYIRVDITGLPSSLHATAFKSPSDNTVVIVVLNDSNNSVTLPLFVAGAAWPASVTPYVTDASNNLAAKTAIAVTGANFTATIGAQSVTTFVGKP